MIGLTVCCVVVRKKGNNGSVESGGGTGGSGDHSAQYKAPVPSAPDAPEAPEAPEETWRLPGPCSSSSSSSLALQHLQRHSAYTQENKGSGSTCSATSGIVFFFLEQLPPSAEYCQQGGRAGGGRTIARPSPTFSCSVCLDDEVQEGVTCNLGHFICKTNGCMGNTVRDQIQSHVTFKEQNKCQIYCSICLVNRTEGRRPFSEAEVCQFSPSPVISEYIKACKDVDIVAATDALRKDFETKMAADISLKEQRIQQHRLAIVDSILTDKCPNPRCGTALDLDTLDFASNCMALKCSSCPNAQQCCGWCFQHCGVDAHPHVKACKLNPTADKNFFTSREAYFTVQRRRKRGKIEAYLQAEVAAEIRPDVRAAVAMQTDPLGARYLV